MTYITAIITFLKYLPEMLDVLKTINEQIQRGRTEIQIRNDIKRINAAFNNPNRSQAARELNNIFRGN